MKQTFKVFGEKGFTMTFENGLTISVMFGGGNYCSNRNITPNFSDHCKFEHAGIDAEIGIWDENDVWFNFKSDRVKGWVTPDEVAKWITKVQKAKDIKSIKE